jgi:hypothetical protein
MKLTRIQRNEIFKAIGQSTLDPAECDLVAGDGIYEITHKSGSRVNISHVKSSGPTGISWLYMLKFTVVDGPELPAAPLQDFDRAGVYIRRWADEVKRITDAPDLWAEMQRSRELITDIQRTDFSNIPFTQSEQEQITAQLQEIKKQVKEQFALSNEQVERIEERLDEADEARKRTGRKDWLLLFSGTIFTLIITGTVTPVVAEQIFTMAIHGLIHLFTGGGEPPRVLT